MIKLPIPPGPNYVGFGFDYDTMHHFDDDDDDDEPRCAHCHMPIYVRTRDAGDGRYELRFFHTLTLFKHCDAAMSKEATPERA